MDLLQHLKQNPFVLAPMAGITDCSFRSFMRELGCGVVITELVSATGIEYKSSRTLDLMNFEESQRPIGIQLFGDSPESLAAAAKVVEACGADFVDLNFGCPVPKVVKKGGGSAILRDLDRVEATFRAVKAATRLPVTVKIRTGWDETQRNAAEVAKIAFNEGLTWVAIHGRTRHAGYSGLADWDFIAEVKAKSQIPILGNGDIASGAQAVERLKQSGCDGVMIGRGCLKDPWIFREARLLWEQQAAERQQVDSLPTDPKDFTQLFKLLYRAFSAPRPPLLTPNEKIILIQLKKFASWYSSGYPGASQFRKSIFQTQTVEETMTQALGFFEELKNTAQADTSREAFLMGGHG
jgi:nifR3 family TIM-barrel protein